MFALELKTELDRASSQQKKFCDKLILTTLTIPEDEYQDGGKIIEKRRALFQCVVDNISSGYDSHPIILDSIEILDQTFYDVFAQDRHGEATSFDLLVNFEFGILQFRGFDNKTWWFSQFYRSK